MANEANRQEAHDLHLDDRSKLRVSGVKEIESFDESAVVLQTVRGLLIVRGQELHLNSLSTDGGQVSVSGTINSLSYEELQKSGGFFRRLFG